MKKFEVAALLLVIMGAFGIVLSLLLGLQLYDAWSGYEDPFPTIVYLPVALLFTVFLFVLSSSLHKGKSWAWHVGLWLFLLFTVGDVVTAFYPQTNLAMLLVAIFHGAGAYLLYADKDAYFSPGGERQEIAAEDQQQTADVQGPVPG